MFKPPLTNLFMRLLFLGDVMGRAGRKAIQENLPRLREEWRADFVVVNGENSSNGMVIYVETFVRS